MNNIDIPKSKRDELENTVVQLDHVGSVDLPPTLRLTGRLRRTRDFIVARNLLFLRDHYGPLKVYDLSANGQEICQFMFNRSLTKSNVLENMATDGSHMYLHVGGGKLYPKDDDILIAKITEPFESESSEGIKYRDGFCEFIGQEIRELSAEHYISRLHFAEKSGIVGRISSFSLDDFLREKPSLVWDPDLFTGRNPRFLIHKDMDSLVYLRSGEGSVTAGYNYHSGEVGCQHSFRLKKGKLDEGKSESGEERIGDITVFPLEIEWDINSPTELSARIEVNETLETKDLSEPQTQTEYFPLGIVFKGSSRPPGKILGLQHSGERLYVLREPVTSEDIEGAWRTLRPARMDSYNISLKQLVS